MEFPTKDVLEDSSDVPKVPAAGKVTTWSASVLVATPPSKQPFDGGAAGSESNYNVFKKDVLDLIGPTVYPVSTRSDSLAIFEAFILRWNFQ